MPLPTTNLTLHIDASDADKLFTTYNSSGVHTGTPTDGSAVQVWDNEADGSVTDFVMMFQSTSGQSPAWRTTTPLMLLPCLDFDGTDDALASFNQTGLSSKAISNVISASAFTVFVAFYAESVVQNSATPYNNDAITADNGGYWGIHLKANAGSPQIEGYVYSGGEKKVTLSCSAAASHVVRFRYDGTNLYLQLDGGTESSPVASGSVENVGLPLQFGKGSGASALFNGRIGEAAFYNANLTGTPLSDATAYFSERWLTAPGGLSIPVAMNHFRQRRN